MALFDIPEHWSAEQSLAVYEVLAQLQNRILEYYEVPPGETLQLEIAGDLRDPHNESVDFDDDLPFSAQPQAEPVRLTLTAGWRTVVADTTAVRLLAVLVCT